MERQVKTPEFDLGQLLREWCQVLDAGLRRFGMRREIKAPVVARIDGMQNGKMFSVGSGVGLRFLLQLILSIG